MRCGGRNSARRGGSAAQYRKRGIHSVPLVEAADHGGCAVSGSRQYCTTHLRRSVKAHAFPRNGTFVMRDIPENPHKRRDFAAGKRTSNTSLINIHQKKDVCQYRRRRIFPFGDSGGAFFVPEARAGRGRYTRQRSAYRNKRKRAPADMPHRGVEKVYAPNAPSCAKIRFPYHKHRTRRIGGTKFHPRKRGYNICEQPRFSR